MAMHSKAQMFEQSGFVLVRVTSLDFVLHLSQCSRSMLLMAQLRCLSHTQ